MAVADLTRATKGVIKLLAAQATTTSEQYLATASDPRFATAEIQDVLISVDLDNATIICKDPDNGRRVLFLTTVPLATITSQTTPAKLLLPTHVGPIEAVEFAITGGDFNGFTLQASPSPNDEGVITWENRNPNALALYPRFTADGNSLYVNAPGMIAGGATSITVNITAAMLNRTGALQCPEEMEDMDIVGAAAVLAATENDMMDMAHFYGQQWQIMKTMVAQNAATIPQLRLMSKVAPEQAVAEGS